MNNRLPASAARNACPTSQNHRRQATSNFKGFTTADLWSEVVWDWPNGRKAETMRTISTQNPFDINPPPVITSPNMPTQYTIWCNAKFPADAHELLLAGTAHHHLIFSQNLQASNLSAGRPDPALNDADLVFGQPDPELILNTPKLRWVHLNSAGYERYDRLDLRQAFHTRNAQVTNSSMV